MKFDEIKDLFEKMLESINYILKNDFYSNKYSVPQIKDKVEKWYSEFNTKKTLTTISVDDLQFIDWEITEVFDIYFKHETSKSNYTERLLYDFSILERYWKDEMLGGNKNE